MISRNITKNEFTSQVVLLLGGAIMIAGFVFDPSRVGFVFGYTMIWFGMIHSYYLTVLEDGGLSRMVFAIAGIPLSLGALYLSYTSLRDNLGSWISMAVCVLCVLALQAFATWVAIFVWNRRSISK